MSLLSFGPGTLRFVLAFMVVIAHVSRFNVGVLAVMAFFVLSGYWVASVYARSHAGVINGDAIFYLSRILRIFPVYIFVFVTVWVLSALVGKPLQPDVWMALPLLGIASHGRDIIGVSWSLDIELQFYLLLPFLISILRRPGEGFGLVAVIGGTLTSWGFGVLLAGQYGIVTVLLYLPLFLAGMAIHLLDMRVSRTVAGISLLLFVLTGLLVLAMPATRGLLLYGGGDRLLNSLFSMAWCIPLLPFIAYNVRQPSPGPDRFLGDLSYPVYLVHFPMVAFSAFLLGRDMNDWEKLVFLVLVMIGSTLLHFIADRPFEKFRQGVIRDLLGRQRQLGT